MAEPRFIIAGECFRYKKDVEARIRAIKDGTPMHADIEGQDKRFVLSFFAWHPTKSERISDAVCVRVVRGVGEGDKRFEFYLAEGSSVDASYRKPLRALTGLDDHRYSVLEAMRRVAHQQAWDWAVRTHGAAAYEPGHHVHHEPEFKALVARFLAQEGALFADVQLDGRDSL